MQYLVFDENQKSYPIAILVNQIHKESIRDAYITPFGINEKDVIVYSLYQNKTKKKTPIKEVKEYADQLYSELLQSGCKYVVVADGDYFKVFTDAKKIDASLGYVLPLRGIPNLGMDFVYVPNFKAIFYDPVNVNRKISLGMLALVSHRNGCYQEPGYDIIESAEYWQTDQEIADGLERLLEMDIPLSVDIEAFSLNPVDAGIGTISFSWDNHNGVSFPVDYYEVDDPTYAEQGIYGVQIKNDFVRSLLKSFFQRCNQRLTYHNASYDITVLVYQLYMDDITDTVGLLTGLEVMLKNWDDTKLITYLATNTCAGNDLGLKAQAQEFAGNWAEDDIKDIRKIPLPDLLRYNVVDTLSTNYVYEKWYNKMVEDDQLDIYLNIFKPAIVDIIQMQLTGMPLSMVRTLEVEKILQADLDKALDTINNSRLVEEYIYSANEAWVVNYNNTRKVKRVTLADAKEVFNPASPLQLQKLLFEQIGLPVLDLTDSKQPATGGKVLKDLMNHTKNPDVVALLDALIDYKAVDKILGTFIPAFKNAYMGSDGWHYLCGNFNLGGTVSGRLSSSNPNLQNLPASGKYGKIVKSCFIAPPGWLLVGLDFASLEDRISALTTKDPNKLKVYTDGYDGHCLRAFAYFGEQMVGIVDTVESINSIDTLYKDLRGDSKAPTFAFTYQGTWVTVVKNLGWTEEKAKRTEQRFKELYKVSIEWVNAKLEQATKDGYVTVAFGLRVRTPMLHQVILGNSKTPFEASAEGRTAGNALGQSWCLLNSRAASEFMGKVRQSKFKYDIRHSAQIHDASYYMVRDDLKPLMYLNEHLVKAVQWQDHPDIYHDEVKLGGDTSVFFPSWAEELVIPNYATKPEIESLVEDYLLTL